MGKSYLPLTFILVLLLIFLLNLCNYGVQGKIRVFGGGGGGSRGGGGRRPGTRQQGWVYHGREKIWTFGGPRSTKHYLDTIAHHEEEMAKNFERRRNRYRPRRRKTGELL